MKEEQPINYLRFQLWSPPIQRSACTPDQYREIMMQLAFQAFSLGNYVCPRCNILCNWH